MTRCPYPEKIRLENGVEFINYQYQYWHEGYEAHKIELLNQSMKLASLAKWLENKIMKIEQLEAELQISKDSKKSP
jgi:hypothetical protein